MSKSSKGTDREFYRQSCDLPVTRNRIDLPSPHVPVRAGTKSTRRPEPVVDLPAPVKAPIAEIAPPDPSRLRRNFHLRIATAGLMTVGLFLFNHLR